MQIIALINRKGRGGKITLKRLTKIINWKPKLLKKILFCNFISIDKSRLDDTYTQSVIIIN